MQRSTLSAVILLLALTVGVSVAMGGFQVKSEIGTLSVDGWPLESRDGQVGVGIAASGRWLVSAPTITAANGEYISGDPEGKAPTVRLVKNKGPHATWAFELLEVLQPQKARLKFGGYLVGESGIRFKMKLAEGSFKDWYLAVGQLPGQPKNDSERPTDWQPLRLVKDPKLAAICKYREFEYRVGHK